MNVWVLAAIGFIPPLALSAVLALRGPVADRLVAVQFCTTIAALMFVLLTVAFDQPSFLDLGLALVLLTYPGTLIYTWFVERWL